MSGDLLQVRDDQAEDITHGSRRSQSSGEDLFLSLARDDEAEAAVAENAAARSRVSELLQLHVAPYHGLLRNLSIQD